MMLPAIGALLVGAAITTFVVGLMARRGHRPLPRDLGYRQPDVTAEPEDRVDRLTRLAGEAPLFRRMAGWLRTRLPRAGVERSPAEFLLMVGGTGSAAGLAMGTAIGPATGFLTALGVMVAPMVWVRQRAIGWSRRFDEDLPDALDLMAGSLEAGASLSQAMELVASEGQPPLSEEFSRILGDNRLGEPLVDALETGAVRIGSQDFTWCARAIRVQQEFGASLAGLMRTLAQFMRWRQELRREVRALTAEGRISAYVLIGLPFAVAAFFGVAKPDYLALLVTTPLGWIMSIMAATLMTVGAIWMTRMVKVEV
jgi:tight adherence protein B